MCVTMTIYIRYYNVIIPTIYMHVAMWGICKTRNKWILILTDFLYRTTENYSIIVWQLNSLLAQAIKCYEAYLLRLQHALKKQRLKTTIYNIYLTIKHKTYLLLKK